MTDEHKTMRSCIDLSPSELAKLLSVVAEACIISRKLEGEGPGSPEADDEARRRRRQQYRIIDGASWRWARAQREASRVGDRRYVDDEVCNQIADFLTIDSNAQVVANTETEFSQYWSRCFRDARALFSSPIDRLIVESLVLAGLPAAEITVETGIDADVVALYESTFFDTREILSARAAIMCYVIDRSGDADFDPMRSELLKVSYFGGRVAAMGVVDYLRHLHEDHDLTTEFGIRRRQFELLIQSRQQMLGSQLQDNRVTAAIMRATSNVWLSLPTVADLVQSRLHQCDIDLPLDVNEETSLSDGHTFVATTEIAKSVA